MRLSPRIFSLALLSGLAACASAPTSAPPTAANIPTPRPPKIIPNVTLDTAGVEQVIPAFQTDPLVTWGPLPPGTEHPLPPKTYDLQHQIIRVSFDWTRHAVIGTTTLRIAALETPLRSIDVNAVNMKIQRVTGANNQALTYRYNDTLLTIRFAKPLAAHATTSVTIAYETVKPERGAYFVDRRHVLWTQGETDDTRYWIPTADRPDDMTTWEMYVVTDSGERALSNGRLVGSRPVPHGIEWHWSLEQPAVPYLMSVVTGNYTVVPDKWRNVPLGYWTYPDSADAARRGFAATPRAMAVYERVLGVPYPWVKYDQSTVPDFIFGGEENVTATTQNDNGILHPAWAEPQANADALVAHELAHQWFGDLLTTRDWANAWLNESFATFMEQIFREKDKGVNEAALGRLNAQEAAITADRKNRRPIVYGRWEKNSLEVFFTGHIYPKGATVLQTLRHDVGDSLFWAAIHRYVSQHMHQNVVTEDLRAAFEATTGRNFKPFFDRWVYGAGFPVYQVSYTYDSTKYQVTVRAREVQPRDSLTQFFDADVPVTVMADGNAVRGVVPMRGGTGEATFALRRPLRAIRWNEGRWILALTDFPRPTSMLTYQLSHDVDVLGRIEAIDLLQRRTAQGGAIAALVRAAHDDRVWGVRKRAVDALATVNDSTVTRALLNQLEDPDARVRQAAAAALGKHAGPGTVAALGEVVQHDTSLIVRGVALGSYLMVAGDAGLPLAEQVMAQPSWQNVLRRAALPVLKGMSGERAQALYARYAGDMSPSH